MVVKSAMTPERAGGTGRSYVSRGINDYQTISAVRRVPTTMFKFTETQV